jgi:hypothetical protein
MYRMTMSFIEMGALKAAVYSITYINLYAYFPHSLSKLRDIWCRGSKHSAVVYLYISEKLATGKPQFSYLR